jgi:uncharacterized protein YegP (UPF0339 family)
MKKSYFEIVQKKTGEYFFRLKARNGQVIARSVGYERKEGLLQAIEEIRKIAETAEVVDLDELPF